MKRTPTVGEVLRAKGVSRRGFLKYCATTASILALPPSMIPRIAEAIESARRPSVIWLSFQECTGCTESLTRSASPTVEGLIFDTISLDYHHTLQAAAGDQAEAARHAAMEENDGGYLVLVDGSIPLGQPGFSTIAGISNVEMLKETVAGAAAVVAIGSCAAFGGIPGANPNPTGAVSVMDLVTDKPVINVPGCPPIPMVMTAVLDTFPDVRYDSGSRQAWSADDVLRHNDPRSLLSPPVLRAGQVRQAPSMMKARRRAGACTNSAAKARRRTTPVPRPSGTAARASRSKQVTPASDAPNRNSGTAGGFYEPLSTGNFDSGEKLAGAAAAGVALGAVAAAAGRRRQAKFTKEG